MTTTPPNSATCPGPRDFQMPNTITNALQRNP